MRKIVLLALTAALTFPVWGADAWKTEFAKHWEVTKEFTLAVANAMPAEDYNFKPNPVEMSFGKLMVHIAMANNSAFARVSGMQRPEVPESLAAAYKAPDGTFQKEEVIRFLTDSFDFCTKALSNIDEAKLDATYGRPPRQMTGREWLWAYFTHTAHHRGQAEVYMRVKDIKPPSYRF